MKVGITTVFNPTLDDIVNVIGFKGFFDILLIVDNSPLSSAQFFSSTFENSDVFVLSNFNFGGLSGAFNLSKKLLLDVCFDEFATVTLLDQDTLVSNEIVNCLVDEIFCMDRGVVIGAKFSNNNQIDPLFVRHEVTCLPTSTMTMRAVDFVKSSDFLVEFPIDFADFVWCWRNASENGFKFFELSNVHVLQQLGISKISVFGIERTLPNPFRHELQSRAVRRLWQKDFVQLRIKFAFSIKLVLKVILYPFFAQDGFVRLRFMLRGIFF